jgi:flagellar FliJ protein
MKRSERMVPVKQVLSSTERDRARDLGATQRVLTEAEVRLLDLQQYQKDYLKDFEKRAKAGGNALSLRDYQQFLARLQEAVKQQEQIVAQARDAVAASTQRWQGAARRVKAIESVVDKWQHDEARTAGRVEQKTMDERAQRPAVGSGRKGAGQ